MYKIVKLAQVMPTDWIMKEKSRATGGAIPNTRVITGKATAAPPSEVAPATIEPNTMVMDMYLFKMWRKAAGLTRASSIRAAATSWRRPPAK